LKLDQNTVSQLWYHPGYRLLQRAWSNSQSQFFRWF